MLNGAEFISVDEQKGALANMLPVKSYSRKNYGYIEAIKSGAEWILDTDDDTGQLAEIETYIRVQVDQPVLSSDNGFVNSYKVYGSGNIWPRGLPLDHIFEMPLVGPKQKATVPVRQFMIAGDTDVDAIYRLTNTDLDFKWRDSNSYLVSDNNYCPFNSQATLWNKMAFPLMYIPATTTMRMCDILRGYVAQRCMREKKWHLGLGPGLFHQDRNPHDYMIDFEDEIHVYLYIKKIAEELDKLKLTGDLCIDIKLCYEMLVDLFQARGVIEHEELNVLDAWVNALKEAE